MRKSTLARPVIRAEFMQCALQDRVFSLGMSPADRHWRGILMLSGRGTISDDDDELRLRAPCLMGLPWSASALLRIQAGGVGYQLAMDDLVITNAIGHNPDSADLRLLVGRRVLVPLENAPEVLANATHAFQQILRETRNPGIGSETMVEAQLRAVLVYLYRYSANDEAMSRSWGRAARILRHFRQLLEVHFHDRWSVARYGAEIGISADHLHEVCRRELGRTPSQLIRERVIHEACLRLERSSQTVEQIGGALGFRDVGHFSRYFRGSLGQPPGAYRRWFQKHGREGVDNPGSTFSDWP